MRIRIGTAEAGVRQGDGRKSSAGVAAIAALSSAATAASDSLPSPRASFRHPERVAVNYLNGIPCFYRGTSRAEIIWEDSEAGLFCRLAPEPLADALRLARETALRIGDLVELERSEIKSTPDGGRAFVLRPNQRRNRIVNMPLIGVSIGPWLSANSTIADALDGHPRSHRRRGAKFHHVLGR